MSASSRLKGWCAARAIAALIFTAPLRLRVRDPPAKFTGCLTGKLSECPREMTLAGESQTFGDGRQLHPGLAKHLLCPLELGLHHILMRRCAGGLAKDTAEIGRRHACIGRH